MKVITTLILGVGLLTTGCGESEQDADALIKLVSDPALNSEREVAEQLETIEMLFDAQGGFRGVNDNNPKAEGFTPVDPDEDGETELLLSMFIGSRITLPVVGLDAGSNRSTPIAVRARGLNPAGDVVALGGIDARILFAPSGRSEVEVPFNLSRAGLPPRIIAVAPLAVPRDGVLDSIVFYSTAPLDIASLEANVSVNVVPDGGGGDEEVTGTFAGPTACPFGTYMYTFTPAGCHRSAHWLAGVRLVEDGGLTATVAVDQTKEFGDCAPQTRCDEIGVDSLEDIDIACDLQTGRFTPAPCSVAAGGCDGGSVFDWVQASGTPECQAFRADTIHQDGGCVILDPWPCTGAAACAGVGSGTCDGGIGQCIPESCTTSCTPDTLVCVSGEGCLPKIGGCTQDCQSYGACPEFDQECVLGESGGHVCH
jgi:hypothetical protein